MVEKRKSLRERLAEEENSNQENFPSTPDDKLLAGVANSPQPMQQMQGPSFIQKAVPIVAFVCILGLLIYLVTSSSSQPNMTGATVGLNNKSDFEILQSQLAEQQSIGADCANRLLNCSSSLRQPCPICEDPNPECITDLAQANTQLASLSGVDPACSDSLDTAITQRDSFSKNFTTLSGQYTTLNNSYYILNTAFLYLNSTYMNLSKNFTNLNSSYMNCTANSTGNSSYYSNWFACNTSYADANVTIANNLLTINSLNATLLNANNTILNLASTNSYLMANVTCFACWKGQNYTRYFWNETSRELMCTNITWYTYPVNMGAC